MDIKEVPLDQDAPEVTEGAATDPESTETKPRGRGRPKGAPNTTKKEPKSKPREPSPESPKAKRKTAPPVEKKAIKKKKRIIYESSESEEDAPVQDTRNDMQHIAGEVLSLLSSQRANQREQRRNRYAGWFANM